MTDGISYSPFLRTTNALTARNINRNLSQITSALSKVQRQMASGRAIQQPSDDPFGSVRAIQLQQLLEEKAQFKENVQFGSSFLSAADSFLGEMNSLVSEARQLAVGEIGTTASDQTQDNAALMIDSILDEMVTLANSQFRNRYLFGGTSTTIAPFVRVGDTVEFTGNIRNLLTRSGTAAEVSYNVNAADAFGSLSARVQSDRDLDPALTGETLLTDLNQGRGVGAGSLVIDDGTNRTTLDLSGCATVSDVLDAAAAALPATTAMTLTADGRGLRLESTLAGATLTVSESGGGRTAGDLGLISTGPPGASLDGNDLDPRLTLLTPLAALCGGTGLPTEGLAITNGDFNSRVDFGSARTIQDLINAINQSGTHVEAVINDSSTAVDLVSRLCGAALTVGGNSGTTASVMGLRTLDVETFLGRLNNGAGIRCLDGDDFTVQLQDGSSFSVDLSGQSTVAGVLDAINNHADNGGKVTATLAGDGNGIRLQDHTTDAGYALSVTSIGDSRAAEDLGIAGGAEPHAGVLVGQDPSGTYSDSVFTTFSMLRQALLSHDDTAISKAASRLDDDLDRLLNARAVAGAGIQRLDTLGQRIDNETLEVKSALSETVDLDFTEATVRYQSLLAMLQGSLMTAATLVQASLLDFLR